MNLQEFIHEMQKSVFGEKSSDEREAGRCIECGEDALDNCYSEAGRREVKISGLCELCFDIIMGGE